MDKLNLTLTINLQRPDKDGRYPVRIRSCIKRKIKYYPTGISVLRDQFKNREIIKHPNRATLNASLRSQLVQLEKDLIENKIFTKERPADFYSFCESKIKQQKARDNPSTTKHKESYLRKLKKYKTSLNFSDISPSFMLDYEKHCKEKGNKPTTIWGSIKFIKTMINAALNDGIVKGNPLKGYKSPAYVDPVRDYLTDEELTKIENFALKSKSEKLVKVANWFLFSCYSGLRYEDVRTFNKKSIIADRIILRTEKSKTDVSIKIHPKLKNILENISSDVISNQKMNDFLKVIAETCEIQKNLTFHLARHTFAVYFLNHGGSMETLSKLLGHSSLKTTSIYGKITDIRIDSEMDKVWS